MNWCSFQSCRRFYRKQTYLAWAHHIARYICPAAIPPPLQICFIHSKSGVYFLAKLISYPSLIFFHESAHLNTIKTFKPFKCRPQKGHCQIFREFIRDKNVTVGMSKSMTSFMNARIYHILTFLPHLAQCAIVSRHRVFFPREWPKFRPLLYSPPHYFTNIIHPVTSRCYFTILNCCQK